MRSRLASNSRSIEARSRSGRPRATPSPPPRRPSRTRRRGRAARGRSAPGVPRRPPAPRRGRPRPGPAPGAASGRRRPPRCGRPPPWRRAGPGGRPASAGPRAKATLVARARSPVDGDHPAVERHRLPHAEGLAREAREHVQAERTEEDPSAPPANDSSNPSTRTWRATARAGAAERHASGDLARAAGGAGQHQARQVGAHDEQHQADRAPQDEQRRALFLDQAALERLDPEAGGGPAAGRAARGLPRRARDRRHLGLRLLPGDPRPHAGEHGVVLALTLAGGRGAHRGPDLGRCGRPEPFRHHADHRVRLAAEQDRAAQDARVRPEGAAPQAVGEHGERGAARHVLLGGEGAAERGSHPEDLEETGAHPLLVDVRGPAVGEEVDPGDPVRERGLVDRLGVVAHRLPGGPGLGQDVELLPVRGAVVGRKQRQPVRLAGTAAPAAAGRRPC